MKIQKILNNNVVISRNEQGREIVVMGRGLAFKSKVGDTIDPKCVEKTFTISEPSVSEKFQQVVQSIPLHHILMAERIINTAKTRLGKKINDSIYVTLPDHISGSIARYREHIVLNNPLKWDIRRFYPDEYAIGCKATQVIGSQTGSLESDRTSGETVSRSLGRTDCLFYKLYRLADFRHLYGGHRYAVLRSVPAPVVCLVCRTSARWGNAAGRTAPNGRYAAALNQK